MTDNLEFETLYDVHNFFETSVLNGELPIHQTSEIVQLVFNLGFVAGQNSMSSQIEQAKHERDIYYRVAARGGFGTPRIKNQGKSFAQLEALRQGVTK
jgi:hypothetical protein